MVPRFYVPDLDPDRADTVLPPEEGHHLTRVLRLRVGDEVDVFDGRGTECRARVASVAGARVTVAVLFRHPAPRAPRVALTLIQSVLKPDAMDDVVRDATMIGFAGIQPVIAARTTVKNALISKSVERWRRIALASAKQCGRATLPAIDEAIDYPAWLQSRGDGPAFLLVEPGLALPNTVTPRDLVEPPATNGAAIVVGPEGGWTRDEIEMSLHHGCVPLSLGPLTLRAAAVPFAAGAILMALWNA